MCCQQNQQRRSAEIKLQRNPFRPRLGRGPRWENLQRFPRPLSPMRNQYLIPIFLSSRVSGPKGASFSFWIGTPTFQTKVTPPLREIGIFLYFAAFAEVWTLWVFSSYILYNVSFQELKRRGASSNNCIHCVWSRDGTFGTVRKNGLPALLQLCHYSDITNIIFDYLLENLAKWKEPKHCIVR